ncbi:tRNA uridine(34) 5-carboxymethylaminomethyl modification radical SAM/GNAT enzyme Elp3, partial [Candidatus Gribaldobacteria bacterium]|nr:tRNA uridine(34) 5-carboxymethylaminomethyl modification radical SAM/GNAT enzyme Elp3 [Candidatus Gribaldobacteria bacterium]
MQTNYSKETIMVVSELNQAVKKNRADLNTLKRGLAKKYKIPCPRNIALLAVYHKLFKEKRIKRNIFFENLLRTRPIRSLSGVVNVSLLTKPWACFGKCLFCPNEPGMPKSYLKQEPACQRALLVNFSPKKQITTRLSSLIATGHPIDKIEMRLVGGTWDYYPLQYRKWFIKECYVACNNFQNQKSNLKSQKYKLKIKNSNQLKQEQKQNETAKARIVGLSVETRPDCINEKSIKSMREFGVTKVELGIQTIFDDVLSFNQRGHLVKETIRATKMLKQAGFKVSYQLMPNLPKSNPKKDALLFKEIFNNPNFMPDSIKIYPLALLKNTEVYKLYQKGEFKPYSLKELLNILLEIKKQIPYWCRVERVVRDIPSNQIIEGGAKTSNLRELLKKELLKKGLVCHCIRCREVGKNFNQQEKILLFKQEYEASNGKEIFLSFENKTRTKL